MHQVGFDLSVTSALEISELGSPSHAIRLTSEGGLTSRAFLAAENGGVSRLVTPRERVDLAAVDLFASIGRPVASGLKAPGNIQPAPPATVFAGTPVLLFGEEDQTIKLTWDAGALESSYFRR